MTRRLLTAVLSFASIASSAFAQPATPQIEPLPPIAGGLTLEQAEAHALTSNPTLAQAAARIRAAQGRQYQVGLRPNPEVGYQGTEMGNDGAAGQQGLFVNQQFVTGNKLGLSRAVVEREIRQARHQLDAQRFRVLSDVRVEFYNALAAQRTAELAQALVDVNQRAVNTANQLFQAQEVGQADVLQARIEANTAQIELQNARNRYLAAWRRLAAVMGTPEALCADGVYGELTASLPDYEWCETLEQLVAGSPQVAAACANLERARMAVARSQAERTPNVDVSASVQYDTSTESTIGSVQLGMPIPVHNANQGNQRQAVAELQAAAAEVQRVKLLLQKRLATAYEQYANARQQVERYENDILPDAQRSLDLVNVGFRQGEFGYLNVLTAQRTYYQTNLAYIDALRQLRTSTIEIEGFLLTESLENAPEIRREGFPDDNQPQS